MPSPLPNASIVRINLHSPSLVFNLLTGACHPLGDKQPTARDLHEALKTSANR